MLDAESLHRIADHAPHVVAEELDEVLDLEPLLRLALEVDPVRDADGDLAQIAGLGHHQVGDLVVEHPQIDGLEQAIIGLRGSHREGDRLEGFIVFQEIGRRAGDDFALAALADDEDRISRPDVDRDGPVILGVQCDGSRRGELVLPREIVAAEPLLHFLFGT